MKETWDAHHVLYQKRDWRRITSGRLLRQDHSLIVPMDYHIHHDELHRDPELWRGVPILGAQALRFVQDEYEPRSTHLSSIDALLRAINHAKDPKSEMAAHVIEMQLPYIRAGIVKNKL